jgi:predicted DNA-binding transcriptional regulator AlpA
MSKILEQLQTKYNKLGLSRTELAQELGISIATLDRMLVKGEDLPKYKRIGNRYFFPLEGIASYLENTQDDGGDK